MIHSMRRALPVVLVLFSAGCAVLLGHTLRRPSDDPIRVPHQRHAKADVACLSCHESIYDATTLAYQDTQHLPKEEKCLECHKEKKEKGECGFCHTDVRRAGPWVHAQPEPRLKLSHAKHIELVKEDCSRCHAQLPERATPVGTLTPTMDACRSCHVHEKQYRDGNCDTCHVDLTRYPLRPLSDFRHTDGFGRDHARAARTSTDTCAGCHDQTFCADCHTRTTTPRIEVKFSERVTSDFIHRNDFLGRHAVEARAQPAACQRCHGESFCTSCHKDQGLTPEARDPRNPHPSGWSIPGSASFHGPAARRDIVSCASCHDQGPRSNCISCHKVGAPGGDPHPPGWSSRHGRDEIRGNSMCLYCHL